jgi:tRNA nucleotidyltransferase (CCA-adding enzyme)
MAEEFDEVVAAVRERVSPDERERERLDRVVTELRERVETALADPDLPVDAADVEVIQVGSTARDTWLAGDRDVDLFVAVPPALSREELETVGLAVGHAVLPEGREEYAEHPYVHGEYDGFAVDLVPCYAVDSATDIRSAVDRTPFHTRYLADRIDADLAGQIRVAKQFLTAVGVYGSDLRTRGFSGYLTELLVVAYGGFRAFVEAAADWHPPVELDPAGHGAADDQFDDPLVVVDPTDPERNVAAVCSPEAVARLQHYAREVLADPRESLFDPSERGAVDAAAVEAAFADRGTTPVAVRFDAPDLVEDQLYPQLRKSRQGLRDALDRRGFDVLRSDAFADETAVLLFELSVAERPAVERHEGPPVAVRDHATGFFEAYAADPDVYGPFVEGDRYVVERPREFTSAVAFLESDAVFDAALGSDLADALDAGYEVLVGTDVAELAGEFGVDLAAYLDPRP